MITTEARSSTNAPIESFKDEEASEVVAPSLWRRKTIAVIASIAMIGTGAVLASNSIETACHQRNMLAPGGAASPASVCETNDRLRETYDQKVMDIRIAVIDAAFDPLFV